MCGFNRSCGKLPLKSWKLNINGPTIQASKFILDITNEEIINNIRYKLPTRVRNVRKVSLRSIDLGIHHSQMLWHLNNQYKPQMIIFILQFVRRYFLLYLCYTRHLLHIIMMKWDRPKKIILYKFLYVNMISLIFISLF